ncbi:MAG: cytochrome c [Chitinophagales bacterium]|nr:cytochrome c [Chitinophagales bacterium]
MGKSEQLAKYTKVTKVPEMIISFGFLATGVWMMLQGALFNNLIVIKLICIFTAIPLAVIGFKKSNKALATLAVILIIASYGLAEMNRSKKTGKKIDTSAAASPLEAGKMIYENSCVNCHGSDGKTGNSGAKNLAATTLTIEEQKERIRKGKNAMPAYSDEIISESDLDAVIEYLGTFKQ